MPRAKPFKIGGELVVFKFDYDRLEQLRTVFGETSAAEFITMAADRGDVRALAKVASVASSPSMSEETIFRESPPIMPLTTALSWALSEAYFGRGLDHQDDEPREPANPRKRRATRSPRRTTGGSKPADRTKSSGDALPMR